jgi:transposase
MLSDEQWARLEPLLERCRPRGRTPPHDLRGTIEAILWRHHHRGNWRAVPQHYAPWWRAAQTFNRWSKQGVWTRLLDHLVAQFEQRGWALPPAALEEDGCGARQDDLWDSERQVRRLIALLQSRPGADAPAAARPEPGEAAGPATVEPAPRRDDATRLLLARTETAIAQAASLRAAPAPQGLAGRRLAASQDGR